MNEARGSSRELELPNALRVRLGTLGERLPVVFVEGELDLAGAESLAGALTEAGAKGRAVIVDLTACSFIDSTGISTLLHAAGGHNGSAGATLAIACEGGQVARTLELTDVGRVVPIFRTGEEAARALESD
jgi:anti-anti-sigma factor